MSAESSTVTPQHFAYIAAHTTPEDDLLRDLRADAMAQGVPAIWISPEQAALQQILLKLAGAREVVEIGTLVGYSAIAMARALPPGGRLRTVEINERHAEIARQWIARSDVADRIEVIVGRGDEVLPHVADKSVDALFLDADKGGYIGYTQQAARILRPGGLLLADNAFAFGQLLDEQPTDREVPAIRAYNDWLAQSPDFQSIIVPIGDGCWVGVRNG